MDQSRFTHRARKVMQLANQEAKRFNHEYIGTEHVLLGLVKEGSGVAANVLKNLDIDLRKIRLEAEKLATIGNSHNEPGVQLPYTPTVLAAVDHARNEADKLQHSYRGTEHLLLGLLHAQESGAAQILMSLGASLDDVRKEVHTLLGTPAARQPFKPVTPDTMSRMDLEAALSQIQNLLWYDEDAGEWQPDKLWGGGTLSAVAEVLENLGMRPPDPPLTVDPQAALLKAACVFIGMQHDDRSRPQAYERLKAATEAAYQAQPPG